MYSPSEKNKTQTIYKTLAARINISVIAVESAWRDEYCLVLIRAVWYLFSHYSNSDRQVMSMDATPTCSVSTSWVRLYIFEYSKAFPYMSCLHFVNPRQSRTLVTRTKPIKNQYNGKQFCSFNTHCVPNIIHYDPLARWYAEPKRQFPAAAVVMLPRPNPPSRTQTCWVPVSISRLISNRQLQNRERFVGRVDRFEFVTENTKMQQRVGRHSTETATSIGVHCGFTRPKEFAKTQYFGSYVKQLTRGWLRFVRLVSPAKCGSKFSICRWIACSP